MVAKSRRAARRLLRAVALPVRRLLTRLPRPYACAVALLQPWSFEGLRYARRATAGHDLRIGYVVWRFPTLHETFIRREVQALREAGVPVRVFALEPGNPMPAEDPASPIAPVTYFGSEPRARGWAFSRQAWRRRPFAVLRLLLFIVRHRDPPDKMPQRDRSVCRDACQLAAMLSEHGITHVHSPWANSYALLSLIASRLAGASFSVQARAYDIHRSVPREVIADRLRFAEFCIVNSRYNADFLRSQLAGSRPPPIHVVYNGVKVERFRPGLRVDRQGPLRILAVGRLVEQKGFRDLLRACHLLRERGVDFTCEIIGGPIEPADTVTWLELRMLHTRLGLDACVRFCGSQPFASVLAALERADLVVLPSVAARDGGHDVTPNCLIEAMAMGLPVVSTTIGAIPEIVDHERDGLLVPPNDEQALAAAIERLMHSPELRRTLGAAARRRVEERFDVDRNVMERKRLFQSLLGRTSDTGRALIAAARGGDLQTTVRLLNDGASPDAPDRRGRTALHEAAARGHADVAACLLARGANPRVEDGKGRTALDARNTTPEVLHQIRQRYHRRRADPEATLSRASEDARHLAAELAQTGIVKISGLVGTEDLARMRQEFQGFIESLDARLSRGDGIYKQYDEEEHFWQKDRAYVSNNAFKHSPTLTRLCCHPTLLDAASLYLGRAPHIQRGGAMRYLPSPAVSNDMFGWHHDMEEKRFKVMILLTGVGEGGQHMSYLVRSHTLFHPYAMFFENPCSVDYCRAHLPNVEVFDAVGTAGDMFVFDSNGAHRGNRSESADIRDVFMVEYTADTSHIWGGDVDPRVLDEVGPLSPNPFDRLLRSHKLWEQPMVRKAATWIENLPHVERWL